MANKRLFVDANILLELLLPGRTKTKQCERYLMQFNGLVVISILSVHIAYYYGKKAGYKISQIDAFLTDFEIAGASRTEYELALKITTDTDFEDALQVAVAKSAGCTMFMTADKKLAHNYKDEFTFALIATNDDAFNTSE